MEQFIYIEALSRVVIRIWADDEDQAESRLRARIMDAQNGGIELPHWTEFWLETTC